MSKLIQVIMPVWCINEQILNLTELAIESLGKCQLLIIDNGSTLGVKQLKAWAHGYIRNEENLGYAKAVNQGLGICEDLDIVAITNNDIRVAPNWQEVSVPLFKNPKVGSVHFRMIPYNQPFKPGSDTWIGGKERWCTSSFFVVRNVQKYDPLFMNSYDDWDFWKRMRDKGYVQAYTNKAEYQHLDSFSKQFNVLMTKVHDDFNREYFKNKHGVYAEEDFERSFPGQLGLPWKPQP